jgi:hypothetical protein
MVFVSIVCKKNLGRFTKFYHCMIVIFNMLHKVVRKKFCILLLAYLDLGCNYHYQYLCYPLFNNLFFGDPTMTTRSTLFLSLASLLTRYTTRYTMMLSVLCFFTALSFLASCTTTPAANTNVVKYDVTLQGENQTPAVNDAGTGKFTGTYDKTTKVITYKITWTLTKSAVATMAHFHGPADSKTNAGVQIGIFGSQNTTGTFEATTAALSDAQAADLLAGRWYVNLHSTLNGSGAIRAQLPAAQ